MKSLKKILLGLALSLYAIPAFADLKVATSLSDLASVAQFVGGKHVSVTSLCKGYQDPHLVPAKPSLMKIIQGADIFISVGLELDGGWLPLVLPGSRNPKIQPGSPGFVDASEGVQILDKPTGNVSRAEGDVHPLGNPHYYLDPVNLPVIANHLAKVFSDLDPSNTADYMANSKSFTAKIGAAQKAWAKKMKPFKGASVVTFHKNYDYFLHRFGLKLFGTVEPKPGIPPSPRYLSETAEAMRKAGVKVVLYQPYYDAEASQQLAKKAGGTALEVPSEVEGVPEARDIFTKFDFIVSTLAKSLSEK